MKKNKIFCVLLLLVITMSAYTQVRVTGKAPKFKANDPLADDIVDLFNDELEIAFNELINELNSELSGIGSKPEKFVQAWGNSAVYASHGATNRAFGGYKIFSATLGSMLGIQLPSSISDLIKDLDDPDFLTTKLFDEGDISLGLSPQVFNVHIGLNTFFVKDLYVGLRIGYFNVPEFLTDGLSFKSKSTTFGITANYQLLKPINLANMIVWRGVNLGSGFIVNSSKTNLSIANFLDLDDSLDGDYSDVNVKIDPSIFLDMNVNTYTIPLEVVTAIKILFVNIPLGLGVDLAFGKTSIKLGADADINVTNTRKYGLTQETEGNISAVVDWNMPPNFFNLKLMTGLGFTFGPAVIDIPITFYLNHGFSVGFTAGASF